MATEDSIADPVEVINSTSGKLEPFSPFQKFIFENVDKRASPQEILDFLKLDKKRREYVSVCMPLDRQGHTQGSADVIAPRTFAPHILNFNRNSSLTLRGNQLHVKTDDSKGRRRKQVWMKTDLGVVTSHRWDDVTRPLMERELRPMQTLVDAGACYRMFQPCRRTHRAVSDIIERAYISGVEKIVLKCYTPREAIKARTIAARYPRIIYFTAGLYAAHLEKWKGEATLSLLRELVQDPQCVAVGEVGMNRDQKDTEKQAEVFTAQVELACELGKPLLLRVKNMNDDVLDILSKFKSRLPSVCVSDIFQNERSLESFHARGFYISLSGVHYEYNDIPWVTKWLHNLLETTRNPRVLLASDSPRSFPSSVDTVNIPALDFRAKCIGIPLVYRVTDRCLLLAKKYKLRSINEPMSLQNLVELIGLAIEPETIATLSRRCSYEFYNFLEVDSNLQPLHVSCLSLKEDALASSSEDDADARAMDVERIRGVKTISPEQDLIDKVHPSRRNISESSQTDISNKNRLFNSLTSVKFCLAASLPIVGFLAYSYLCGVPSLA